MCLLFGVERMSVKIDGFLVVSEVAKINIVGSMLKITLF